MAKTRLTGQLQATGARREDAAMASRTRSVHWGGDQSAYYALRDSRHRYLYDRVVVQAAFGPQDRVLDFGCGSGDFSAEWLAPHVAEVWAYDPDPLGAALAREKLTLRANAHATEQVGDLPGSFDWVVLNAVWMTLPTEAACIGMLAQAYSQVRPGGRMIATVTHPCFRDIARPDRAASFRREDYFESSEVFRVTIRSGQLATRLMDHHWTLSDMSRQLRAAGWRDLQLDEAAHDAPVDGGAGAKLPIWLILEAQRPA